MSTAQEHEARPTIARRPNDFDGHRSALLYSGTCCCCCCCLHWLGAAIGGAVGAARGSEPPPGQLKHSTARRNAAIGGLVGLLVAVAFSLMLWQFRGQLVPASPASLAELIFGNALVFLAFVPCAAFVPVLAGMLAGAWLTRGNPAASASDEGYGCLACGYDLRGSLQQRRCPECGRTFGPASLPRRMESKYWFAWRAGGRCLAFAILGTLFGYAIMVAIGGALGWLP